MPVASGTIALKYTPIFNARLSVALCVLDLLGPLWQVMVLVGWPISGLFALVFIFTQKSRGHYTRPKATDNGDPRVTSMIIDLLLSELQGFRFSFLSVYFLRRQPINSNYRSPLDCPHKGPVTWVLTIWLMLTYKTAQRWMPLSTPSGQHIINIDFINIDTL